MRTTTPHYTSRDRRRQNVRLSPGCPKVIYPGRQEPKLRLAIVRDTSGSMSHDELEAATREVVTIAQKLRIRGQDLVIYDVEAQVHQGRKFRNGSELLAVHGHGGTDMRIGIEHALKTRDGVDTVVVLTDGQTPWPDEPTPAPVVACLPGPGRATRDGQCLFVDAISGC